MKEIVVSLKDVSKTISGISILKGINLELERGNIYGFVGRNGSGKSMLFKTICGLVNPSEGEVMVLQEPIKNGNFSKKTGIIIENPGFLPQYSAFKNLKILANIQNKISDQKIKDTLALVGLDPKDKKPVKKYSLGMKQRLGIAQAIMEDPEILILDEPMNGLDNEGVKLVRNILLNLKSKSVTILLASHNHEDITSLCDCVFHLENGGLTNSSYSITNSI